MLTDNFIDRQGREEACCCHLEELSALIAHSVIVRADRQIVTHVILGHQVHTFAVNGIHKQKGRESKPAASAGILQHNIVWYIPA